MSTTPPNNPGADQGRGEVSEAATVISAATELARAAWLAMDSSEGTNEGILLDQDDAGRLSRSLDTIEQWPDPPGVIAEAGPKLEHWLQSAITRATEALAKERDELKQKWKDQYALTCLEIERVCTLEPALGDLVDAVNAEMGDGSSDIGGKTGPALIQAVNTLAEVRAKGAGPVSKRLAELRQLVADLDDLKALNEQHRAALLKATGSLGLVIKGANPKAVGHLANYSAACDVLAASQPKDEK